MTNSREQSDILGAMEAVITPEGDMVTGDGDGKMFAWLRGGSVIYIAM